MSSEITLKWRREEFEYTKSYCEENVWKLCDRLKTTDIFKRCFAVFISNDDRKIPLWKQSVGQETMDFLAVWDYHVILVLKSNEGSFVADFDSVLSFVLPFNEYYNLVIRGEENMLDSFKRKFRVIPAATFLNRFASDRSHMLRTDDDGNVSYVSPPPSYPPIQSKGILTERKPDDSFSDCLFSGRVPSRLSCGPYGSTDCEGEKNQATHSPIVYFLANYFRPFGHHQGDLNSTNNIQDFISMSASIEYGDVYDLQKFIDFFTCDSPKTE